jgi:hypothetical protein
MFNIYNSGIKGIKAKKNREICDGNTKLSKIIFNVLFLCKKNSERYNKLLFYLISRYYIGKVEFIDIAY